MDGNEEEERRVGGGTVGEDVGRLVGWLVVLFYFGLFCFFFVLFFGFCFVSFFIVCVFCWLLMDRFGLVIWLIDLICMFLFGLPLTHSHIFYTS